MTEILTDSLNINFIFKRLTIISRYVRSFASDDNPTSAAKTIFRRVYCKIIAVNRYMFNYERT